MKKQDISNLVKYHIEQNNDAFISVVAEIAREFDSKGDHLFAQHLMDLISNSDVYVPQSNYKNFRFLEERPYSKKPLFLPDIIEEDVIGVINSIRGKKGLSKFLFYGNPGTGKTESAFQIARLLNRDVLFVSIEQLIDSRLGESAKNVINLFEEINHLIYNRVIVVFDELDALVLNRTGYNDLREMSRVTTAFLRSLDQLSDQITIIATTNIIDQFDKALIRRFDSVISFDRYSKQDLIDVSDEILSSMVSKFSNTRKDIRLFNKILNSVPAIPFPGEMKQIIKTAIAFSDEGNQYDYLRKVFLSLTDEKQHFDVLQLSKKGFTTREIEILTNIPKSSVSRKLKGESK